MRKLPYAGLKSGFELAQYMPFGTPGPSHALSLPYPPRVGVGPRQPCLWHVTESSQRIGPGLGT